MDDSALHCAPQKRVLLRAACSAAGGRHDGEQRPTELARRGRALVSCRLLCEETNVV